MSRDAYIRLGSRGARWWGATEEHSSLVFVDCPPDHDLNLLRSVPGSVFRQAQAVLLRADAPMDSPSNGTTTRPSSERFLELAEQVEGLQLNVHAGLVHQPVGAAAWVEGDVGDQHDSLDRARSVELEALLRWGGGVWQPKTYHYQLPSGEHAQGFVRVADAFQRPRDAEVLASWLHAALADQIGIVADTGTLSALVQALVAALRSRGWRPGAINVLDGYPSTGFDVAEAVREADRGSGILGVLSVNSSGRVRDRLIAALNGQHAGRKTLDVLVNKAGIDDHETTDNGVVVRTWHPRPGSDPLVAYESGGSGRCELCTRAATATIVPVSPRSFDGQLQAAVTRITVSVRDGHANRDLWELCDAHDVVAFDAAPAAEMLPHRPRGEMPIVVDHRKLLPHPEYRAAVVRAFEQRRAEQRLHARPADLILVPDHEMQCEGMGTLVADLRHLLGDAGDIVSFPRHGRWGEEVRAKVRDAPNSIAVLTLGTVTGGILQAALSAVQDARRPGPYELTAWVVHARPEERRAWQTLRNSYASRLVYAWHTYLPGRSPFEEERAIFEGLSEAQVEALPEEAVAFLRRRRQRPADLAGEGEGVLWGSRPATALTPNSIFGQNLKGPTVLAAVGSAMDRARREAIDAAVPARRVFELPAIARSYYDPMILASVLRWLAPHEAWWGWEPGDEPDTIAAMIERATAEQRTILVPELLLAAAQGKLNASGTRIVRAHADALLAGTDLSPSQRGALQLGTALVGEAGTDDEHQSRTLGAADWLAAAATADELLRGVPNLLRDLQQGRLPRRIIGDLENRITDLLDAAGSPAA